MKLADYIAAEKITQSEFAARVGAAQQTVNQWCTGNRLPRAPQMKKIFSITSGAVSPNDFYEAAP